MKKPASEDLRSYYTLGLPLLKLMGILTVLGIVVAVAITYLF